MQYVTKDELKDELAQACKGINDRIDDIKDNHLASIYRQVRDLKWFVLGVGGVLAIVLTLLQLFG